MTTKVVWLLRMKVLKDEALKEKQKGISKGPQSKQGYDE